MRGEAMESISERLSSLEDLYFPRALQSNALNPSERKAILLDLLSRDVAVFLGTLSLYLSHVCVWYADIQCLLIRVLQYFFTGSQPLTFCLVTGKKEKENCSFGFREN